MSGISPVNLAVVTSVTATLNLVKLVTTGKKYTLYLIASSGCDMAGVFQVNSSQVEPRLSSSSMCGGDVAPCTCLPSQASDETFRVTMEDGRDVPLAFRETTKNL